MGRENTSVLSDFMSINNAANYGSRQSFKHIRMGLLQYGPDTPSAPLNTFPVYPEDKNNRQAHVGVRLHVVDVTRGLVEGDIEIQAGGRYGFRLGPEGVELRGGVIGKPEKMFDWTKLPDHFSDNDPRLAQSARYVYDVLEQYQRNFLPRQILLK